MFDSLVKIPEKAKGEGGIHPPNSLYIRGLKCYFFEKENYGKGHAC